MCFIFINFNSSFFLCFYHWRQQLKRSPTTQNILTSISGSSVCDFFLSGHIAVGRRLFFSYVMVASDDWNDGCWGWWVWWEWWWGWWWRTCEVDGSVIDGHWWCIFGVWCMPNPKPIWWWLWCVCGGPWLWLLLEFALFAFDCCLCEFFLFFILRFWNLKRD